MVAPKRSKPLGRPSSFTQDIADDICDQLASGLSLRKICEAKNMPEQSTVFRWLAKDETFRQKYASAREAQTEAMLEEIIDISDENNADSWTDDDGEVHVNTEVVARSRLRVDARKWAMSKLAPKKYGDLQRLEHSGPDGGPIQTKTEVDLGKALEKLTDEELEALRGIAAKVASGE